MFVSSYSDAEIQTAVFGFHNYVWKAQASLSRRQHGFIYQVEHFEIKWI